MEIMILSTFCKSCCAWGFNGCAISSFSQMAMHHVAFTLDITSFFFCFQFLSKKQKKLYPVLAAEDVGSTTVLPLFSPNWSNSCGLPPSLIHADGLGNDSFYKRRHNRFFWNTYLQPLQQMFACKAKYMWAGHSNHANIPVLAHWAAGMASYQFRNSALL